MLKRNLVSLLFCCAALWVVTLGGCTTTPTGAPRINNPASLASGDPLLSLAALAIDSIPDIYSANFLINRTAEGFVRQKRPDLAREMVKRGISLSQASGASANRFQLLVETAKSCIAVNDIGLARRMLQESLEQVIGLEEEALKGAALQAIIEQGFRVQEAFTAVLRDAIDYLYVIQDPAERVRRLTELGQKYQELNVRNRASSLVQQAVAAASAIVNPWARAEAYTLIAKRFRAEGDKENSLKYNQLAVKELDAITIVAVASSDAQTILRLVVNLAEDGRYVEAAATINLLPTDSLRVNAQLALIERSINQKASLQARLQVQRLLNQLVRQDPENQSELSLSSLIRLAEIYQKAGMASDSLFYAQSAMPYLASPRIVEISGYRSRVSILFAQNGRFDDAIAGSGLIRDAYVESQTLRQIAELLAVGSGEMRQRLPWLLAEAERQALVATYLRETALADLAVTSFKLKDDARATRLLQYLTDPYTLSLALVDSAAVRDNSVPLSGELLLVLKRIESRVLQKPTKR